jgi:pSer/pThr/pTyr-binding forkhead associated (FHA) protein
MKWLKRLLGSKKTATLVFGIGQKIIISEDTIYIGRGKETLDLDKDPKLENLITKVGHDIIIKKTVMTSGISKKHAMLTKSGRGIYTIIDQGSTMGTFVNAIRISPGAVINLQNKDKVELSGVGQKAIIRFQILY